MFERFIKTVHVAERYRKAPLAQEREHYLEHLHRSGRSRGRLKRVNRRLLAVAERMKINGKTRRARPCRSARSFSDYRLSTRYRESANDIQHYRIDADRMSVERGGERYLFIKKRLQVLFAQVAHTCLWSGQLLTLIAV